jgi:hypothetical protein
VAPDEPFEALLQGRILRPEPVRGSSVEVRAPLLPRARGRHPDEIDPEADAERRVPAQQLLDLALPQRPGGAPAPEPTRSGCVRLRADFGELSATNRPALIPTANGQ